MLKGVKIKLYPNKEKQTTLNKMFGCYRLVYNLSLAYCIDEYQNNNKNSVNTLKILGKYLFGNLRANPELSFLLDCNTKVLMQSIIDLLKAYKNFFERVKKENRTEKAGFPKFKKKSSEQKMRFPLEALSRKFITGDLNNKINLTKDLRNIPFRCSDSDKKYLLKYIKNVKSVTITKTKSGNYIASILIDGNGRSDEFRKHEIKDVNEPSVNEFIGLDLGIKTYVVGCNDKNEFSNIENPKFLGKSEKLLKKRQRQLSHLDEVNKKKNGNSKKVIRTKNREKKRQKLAKKYEKVRNQKIDFIQKVTTDIINENKVIIVETLNVKGMVKNHKLAKAISNINLGEFVAILEYKAEWYDREIIKVDRWFPSSKTCSCCGEVYKDLKLSEREWTCQECGAHHDRDQNAALNILVEGQRIYKEKIGGRTPEFTLEDYPLPLLGVVKRYDRLIQEESKTEEI